MFNAIYANVTWTKRFIGDDKTFGFKENTNCFEILLREFYSSKKSMTEILLKQPSYELVGICMEVHRELGMGFKEVIYKDALEYEFRKHKIHFEREKKFEILYKGFVLPHAYAADFIVHESIVLEVKATSALSGNFVKQTINYLKAADLQLGIIANFGQPSFISQRVVF